MQYLEIEAILRNVSIGLLKHCVSADNFLIFISLTHYLEDYEISVVLSTYVFSEFIANCLKCFVDKTYSIKFY